MSRLTRIIATLAIATTGALSLAACTYVERERPPQQATVVVPQQPAAVVTPAQPAPTVTVRPSY